MGLGLRKKIGCSGYRIDHAVVDPKIPRKYVMGIECKGQRIIPLKLFVTEIEKGRALN
jgi:hypothetical protein